MKRSIIFIITIIFLLKLSTERIYAQKYTIISLANTNDIGEDYYFDHLSSYLGSLENQFTVVVNGDFSNSMDDEEFSLLLGILSKSNAEKIIVIPGDRDWGNSGPEGWEMILDLEKEIEGSYSGLNISWPLDKACPGPEIIELNPTVSLIAINSQWFNHPYDKPDQEDGTCTISTDGDFLEELEDLIAENSDKNILIAGHFPLVSLGQYGGFFPLSKWISPVPIVSGMITSYKQNVGGPMDLTNVNYNEIRGKIQGVLSKYSSLIYLSGHEKNLQVLRQDENFLINSGSPVNFEYKSRSDFSLVAESFPGIVNLNYYSDGRVEADIVKYDEAMGFHNFSTVTLLHSACNGSDSGSQNTSYVPCEISNNENDLPKSNQSETAMFITGPEYEASGLKRIFLGDHYRNSWTKQIKGSYLDLQTEFGGLSPFAKGGGRQTKSLKFKANNGFEYVFRSVNKDPAGALPMELRNTFIAAVLKDQTTTQHPFGAMAADILLNELDILHAHPKLWIMPDVAELRHFRNDFAIMPGMLEERPTNPAYPSEKVFADAETIKKSFKMFKDLYKDKDNHVNQREFIRARMFDILVGDWGKHEDNWKWAGFDSEEFDGTEYRPIPRDRDHVFSRWDGILPWLADREWAKSSGENFDYKIKGLRSLMWQARHLDRFVASEMTRLDWLDAAMYIQENIDDQTIESAVKNMPPEIYEISGVEIEKKLNSRLADLPRYSDEYYQMLAKEVDVVGSSKKEYFEIRRYSNGNTEVSMFNVKEKNQKGSKQFYKREFFPNETREVRLYGMAGNDVFIVSDENDVKSSIDIRLIGGYGDDEYINVAQNSKRVNNRFYVYDNTGENKISPAKDFKIKKKADPVAYQYERTAFSYNTYFPLIYFNYNADQGFLIGSNLSFTNHRFDKPDFSSIHSINFEISTVGNLITGYHGRFHHVFGGWDLLLGMNVGYPNKFNYFYGIGNETIKDDELFANDFYRIRYNSFRSGFGFLNQFWNRSTLEINFQTEINSEQIEELTIFNLSNNYLGVSPLDIFRSDITLDLDFRDRENLSSRGMRFYLNHETGWALNQTDKLYNKTQANLEQFFSTRNQGPLTLGVKVGGSITSGDVPYYHRYFLGQGENLRGFRSNRFTGDQSLFLNTDLRWKFGELKTSIVPFGYGLRGFYDVGRVYIESEISEKWHQGYGFGIFIIPLKESFSLNVSIAFSEEESGLLLFSLGKTFN